jgi:Flp pilus assembly protein TadG
VKSRGQALVELAVCMPVILLLGLGAAGVVQVADAAAGLRAATEAAVDAAVRAPSEARAVGLAQQRFRTVIGAYPIQNATLTVEPSTFARDAGFTAAAAGDVSLGPSSIHLTARATTRVEPWRTHR